MLMILKITFFCKNLQHGGEYKEFMTSLCLFGLCPLGEVKTNLTVTVSTILYFFLLKNLSFLSAAKVQIK